MANDFASAYAAIVKYDKNDDGTLMVYGKATDDSLDIDQQICDAGWLDTAMPMWFKTGGNIREQHSNIAAGVAKEYEAKADGHYITTLVVDPVSVKKVETGVLKGFSIGIKAPRVVRDQKAANGRIIDGQIVEISLVDRPANPNAKLVLAESVGGESTLTQVEELVEKRDVSTEERERLANRGAAMPDGSYPIKTKQDLKNAIAAYGRAKDPAAVKRHIIRRARALGATDLLPEDWNVKKSAAAQVLDSKMSDADIEKFDAGLFEAARKAIAGLIQVEAGEMAEGHDERMSIAHLLEAASHLQMWFQGEEEEGETSGADGESIELAADGDACECKCDKCLAAGPDGCDGPDCKCADMEAKELVSDNEDGALSAKSAEEEAPVAEEPVAPAAEEPATPEVSEESDDSAEKTLLADDVVNVIIEKAVKSATESVQAEIALLKSANEAVEKKAASLEEELAAAKSLAIGGGPKRSIIGATGATQNTEREVEAKRLLAKAAATTDKELAQGYRDMVKALLADETPVVNS